MKVYFNKLTEYQSDRLTEYDNAVEILLKHRIDAEVVRIVASGTEEPAYISLRVR